MEFTVGQVEMMRIGLCPYCGRIVKGWKKYPDEVAKAAQAEVGIDPETGHKLGCKGKDLVL